jgi:hypothetical protein
MKLFACGVCGQPLMFENTRCERCGHRLGYSHHADALLALEPEDDGWRSADGVSPQGRWRLCANAEFDTCNWIVDDPGEGRYCRACAHNHTLPDLSIPQNMRGWREIEIAKHRLFYTLLKLGLRTYTRAEDPQEGLLFDFLSDQGKTKVLTGHEHGLITLNVGEADPARREKMRASMGEQYRALIGHFRHEIGHYFWDRLLRDGPMLDEYRRVFGDEREDYEEALKRHYEQGTPADWQDHFISAYATTHSWEDFAETWSHYLHIVDSLDTAHSLALSIKPPAAPELAAAATVDPYTASSVADMLKAWVPISFAVNALNRGMGQPDLYPFVLPPPVVAKLEFIHRLVHTQVSGRVSQSDSANADRVAA